MSEYIHGLSSFELVFLTCAAVGGVMLLCRLLLLVLGIGGHDTADAGPDLAVDHGGDFHVDGHHHESADAGFKLFTIHGLTAFLLMFGLVGLALSRQTSWGLLAALAGALVAGMATMWIIARIFAALFRMQSSGTLRLENAMGCEGTVYLTIPAGGTGRVQVTVQEHLREFDATAQDRAEIRTGEPVRVVWTQGDTLVVERIQE
jgi:membrane protein implicated in regulation of membrane protease activity